MFGPRIQFATYKSNAASPLDTFFSRSNENQEISVLAIKTKLKRAIAFSHGRKTYRKE